jgi:signal transduction histidine kinase
MNRLWIRLSLLFTAVVVVAVLAITLTVRLTSSGSRDSENPPPPEVIEYFESQRRTDFAPDVTVVAIVVGVIAISAGVWMSRSLTKPLSELEDGAGAIAGQDLSHRVPVHGSQEMVAVAIAFNNMAAQLEQEEKLRRNLLADVTHELRHPVHILQGNLQAILDDVYPLNKDEIMRLVDQTQHLSVLVNDLHVLAQAEAQQLPLFKQETDIATLVKQTASSFNPLASARNIDLRVELLGTMPRRSLSIEPACARLYTIYLIMPCATRQMVGRSRFRSNKFRAICKYGLLTLVKVSLPINYRTSLNDFTGSTRLAVVIETARV